MCTDHDPRPDTPEPVSTQFTMTLAITVCIGLVLLVYHGLANGWFKHIPV